MKRASRAQERVRDRQKKKSIRYSFAEKEEQNARECIGTNFTPCDFTTLCAINDHSSRDIHEISKREYPRNAYAILRQRSIISGTYRISTSMSPYVPLSRETSSVSRGSFLGWKGGKGYRFSKPKRYKNRDSHRWEIEAAIYLEWSYLIILFIRPIDDWKVSRRVLKGRVSRGTLLIDSYII